MNPFVLCAIFARGGSKGVPRKNLRMLCDKPLIAYAVKMGLRARLIDQLIVSTDDEEIAQVARKCGAQVPFMRPAHLATDDSPELLSWKHALKAYSEFFVHDVKVLLSLPPTSPLREVQDVEACLHKLLTTDADIVITVKESERNPHFNMVTLDDQDNAQVVIPSKGAMTRRQDAPHVFDMTTVAYAARADYVRKAKSLLEGKVKAVVIPRERAWDIDTLLDFEIAEFLMQRKGMTAQSEPLDILPA